MLRPIAVATAIAGTLDILAAVVLTLAYGRAPAAMLHYVASGPFPRAAEWGTAGIAAGLVVHYMLMALMVAAFMVWSRRYPGFAAAPAKWGVLYGLLTYIIMNLVVVPLRFGSAFPASLGSVATQLFCHIVLVGLPIALVAANDLRRGILSRA